MCIRDRWNTLHTPGGSSSGAAVAVAEKETTVSFASDTVGSIRIPASFCGVFGFMSSLGSIPRGRRSGFVLGSAGGLGHSVDDVYALLSTVCRSSVNDGSTFRTGWEPTVSKSQNRIKDIKIAWKSNFHWLEVDTEIQSQVYNLVSSLKDIGFNLSECEFDLRMDNKLPAARTIMLTGFKHWLQRLDVVNKANKIESVKKSHPVVDKTMNSEYWNSSAVDLDRALSSMYQIKSQLARVFQTVDLLLLPTTPFTAPKLEDCDFKDNLAKFASLVWWTNWAGCPSASFPFGKSSNGMPIGLQLIAAPRNDHLIFDVCRVIEKQFPWKRPGD